MFATSIISWIKQFRNEIIRPTPRHPAFSRSPSMLNLRNQTIYVALKHVDMRKSFDGLAAVVQNHFAQNPLNGEYFVFINRPDQNRLLKNYRYSISEGSFCCWRDEAGEILLPFAGFIKERILMSRCINTDATTAKSVTERRTSSC